MVKISILILVIFGFLLHVKAGNIEQGLSKFSTVEFIGNYKIEMIQSDSNYITIINNDQKVDDSQIDITIEDNSLKMKILRDTYVERKIKVKLYYRSVDNIIARRGVQIECDTIRNENISIMAFTGGKVKLGAKVDHANVEIKSGGSVRIYGVSNSADYAVNAGGVIAASFMLTKDVTAAVQAGGEIILNATKTLDASVKAGGSISYKGNPEITSQSVKLGGVIESIEENKE